MNRASAMVGVSLLLLLARLVFFVRAYAVNLLFSDQWGFLTPVVLNLGAWHSYHYQHGSHRMGLPFLFTSYLMKVSNWDVRWEAYFAVGTLFLATLVALALKQELVGPLRFYDVVVPVVFLSPIHYEHTVQTASTSACIFPMLLNLVFAGCIISKNPIIRYGCGSFVAINLIFTGYGIVAAACAIAFFALALGRALRNRRWGEVAAAGSATGLLAWGFHNYFLDYNWTLGRDSLLPASESWFYLKYISALYGAFFQIRDPHFFFLGGLTLLLSLLLFCFFFRRLIQLDQRLDRAMSFLILSSIIYSLLTTLARASEGIVNAQSSRYLMLLLPLFLAWHLYLSHWFSRLRPAIANFAGGGWVIGLEIRSSVLSPSYRSGLETIHAGKLQWLKAYRENETVEQINRRANYSLHGANDEVLNYLRANRLNFIQPQSSGKSGP